MQQYFAFMSCNLFTLVPIKCTVGSDY